MKIKGKLLLFTITLIVLVSGGFLFFSKPSKAVLKILCLGDSLTKSGYGSYPDHLERILGKDHFEIMTRTMAGNTSGEYLRYLKGKGFVDQYNPAIILLMLGTNDVRIDGDQTSVEKFKKNMEEILTIISSKISHSFSTVKVFLILPPPIMTIDSPLFDDSSKIRLEEEIIPALKRIAVKRKIPLIDLFNFFKHKKDLFPGIHPNRKGYLLMAKFIGKELLNHIKGEHLNQTILPSIFRGKIAFQTNQNGNQDIYLINQKGLSQITGSQFWDGYPDFSPDGKRLIFESNRSGRFELYIYDLETKKIIKLMNSPSEDRFPCWGKNKTVIYFSRRVNGREQVFLYYFKNQQTRQLTFKAGHNSLPSVTRDNRNLLVTGNRLMGWNVYNVSLETGDWQLFSGKYKGCRAKFSRDDQFIVWVSHYFDSRGDLLITPTAEFKPRRLTFSPFRDYYPAFSPDGNYIVYSSGARKQKGNHDLKIINIETGKKWIIIKSPFNEVVPCWGR